MKEESLMSVLNSKSTVLLAIGNNSRQDDGLGWAFAERLECSGCFEGEIHMRYQLQVEDSDLISNATNVVFVDAFKGELAKGYELRPCEPSPDFHFSTHAISPESVLHLCQEVYGRTPKAYCMLIQGKEWDIKEGLTASARQHLENALTIFCKKVLAPCPEPVL